jgi:hypothetical protein
VINILDHAFDNVSGPIDANRGVGGISCTPSKDFEKLDHKNAIKHEN